jgi:ATP-dependent DNA ligase
LERLIDSLNLFAPFVCFASTSRADATTASYRARCFAGCRISITAHESVVEIYFAFSRDPGIASTCAKLRTCPISRAGFIPPMLLLLKSELSEDEGWLCELKLDGFRRWPSIQAGVQLRSGNDNDFTRRLAIVSAALGNLPDESVVDGEIVALHEEVRPRNRSTASWTIIPPTAGATDILTRVRRAHWTLDNHSA